MEWEWRGQGAKVWEEIASLWAKKKKRLNQGWCFHSEKSITPKRECMKCSVKQVHVFMPLVDRIMVKEADFFNGPQSCLPIVSCFVFHFPAGQTAQGWAECHPICKGSLLPQANTCTDLITVFCGSHLAVEDMYMYVGVIRLKCTLWLSSCAQHSLRKYNHVLKSH